MAENKISPLDALFIGAAVLMGGYLGQKYVIPFVDKAKAEIRSERNFDSKGCEQLPPYETANSTKPETLINVYDDKCLDNLPNIDKFRGRK